MEGRSGEGRFGVMCATVAAFACQRDQIAAHGGPASNEKRRPRAPLTLYFRKIRPVCDVELQFPQDRRQEAPARPVLEQG